MSHLRGYPPNNDPLIMSSSPSYSTYQLRTSRKTTTYDLNFQQHLVDHSIYPSGWRYSNGRGPTKPDNREEINQRLAQPRPSLSPSQFSENEFERFVQAEALASKQTNVKSSVIPIIEGMVDGDRNYVAYNIPFNNLDHLTDCTIARAKPDLFYGALPDLLDRRVRTELESRIVPSMQHDLPMVPNFFLEVKGPNGTPAVAGRQACYDGALGARGMHGLQSYGKEVPVYDNNAYTITSTYLAGSGLKLFTTHPSQPQKPGGRPQYHMNQGNGWDLTGNIENFRIGVTAYRNARDWAKEKRDECIEAANRIVTDMHVASTSVESAEVSSSTTRLDVAESNTLADELDLDEDISRPHKRLRIEGSDSKQKE